MPNNHKFEKCCFYSQDIASIYRQNNLTYLNFPEEIRLKNVDILEEQKDKNSIPKIAHQIYFTLLPSLNGTVQVRELSKRDLERTLDAKRVMDSSGFILEWILWTDNENAFPESAKKLKAAGFKIQLVKSSPPLNKLIAEGKIGAASDYSRCTILREIGGIYRDLDYKIISAEKLKIIIQKYDFFAGMFGLYISNAFLGSIPDHPILIELIDQMSRNLRFSNETIPEYIQRPCDLFAETTITTGPIALTIATQKKIHLNTTFIDIIFGDGVLFNVCVEKREQGLYVNIPCNYSSKDLNILGLIGNDAFGGTWAKAVPTYYNKYNCTPKEIAVPKITLGEALITCIARDSLSFPFYKVGDDAISALNNVLQNNPQLTKLYLSLNTISADGIVELMPALKVHPNLAMLGLGSNEIGDGGMYAIVDLLTTSITITEVELWGNNIGDTGAMILANALLHETLHIQHLDLSFNNIGANGVIALWEATQTSNITLELWGNPGYIPEFQENHT